MSFPVTWTKYFECEYDARQELLRRICRRCLDDNDEWDCPIVPPDTNNIDELLATPCGCEFDYEEVE